MLISPVFSPLTHFSSLFLSLLGISLPGFLSVIDCLSDQLLFSVPLVLTPPVQTLTSALLTAYQFIWDLQQDCPYSSGSDWLSHSYGPSKPERTRSPYHWRGGTLLISPGGLQFKPMNHRQTPMAKDAPVLNPSPYLLLLVWTITYHPFPPNQRPTKPGPLWPRMVWINLIPMASIVPKQQEVARHICSPLSHPHQP